MGIDAHGLNCMKYAKKFGDFGETVTLGRQNILISSSKMKTIFGRGIDWKSEKFCERLLSTYFGAKVTDSIDNSSYEGASHIHDMNQPMPGDFKEYDTVMDLGTIEHVFNISQALNNMIRLCKKGGQILHVSPGNNFCGHGFWQISPELFFSLYSEKNGFKDTEVFVASRKRKNTWYKVKPPAPGQRVPLMSRTKLYTICRTVLVDKDISRNVQQSDYVEAWTKDNKPAVPKSAFERFKARFRHRITHKYFRGMSPLNPNLVRMKVT